MSILIIKVSILLVALVDVEHLPALAGLDLLSLVLHLALGTLELSARRARLLALTRLHFNQWACPIPE